MIEINVLRKEGELTGYEVKGHAEYADEGEDIVCAAISVLAQTGIFSLNSLIFLLSLLDLQNCSTEKEYGA